LRNPGKEFDFHFAEGKIVHRFETVILTIMEPTIANAGPSSRMRQTPLDFVGTGNPESGWSFDFSLRAFVASATMGRRFAIVRLPMIDQTLFQNDGRFTLRRVEINSFPGFLNFMCRNRFALFARVGFG